MTFNKCCLSLAVGLLASAGAAHASPTQLITNGGFETTDFTGWTVTDLAGGSGSWFNATGTAGPVSGLLTVGPASGSRYAVTDQGGPGTHVLEQTFTVPAGASSVIVSFDMFMNDQSNAGPLGTLLDHTMPSQQHARVDIMSPLAGAFSTVLIDIVSTLIGPSVDAGTDPNPYTSYSFDLTGLVAPGGTYKLRFGEVDNQFFFQAGVDNVSIVAEVPGQVPEPMSAALLGLGLLGVAASRRRRSA